MTSARAPLATRPACDDAEVDVPTLERCKAREPAAFRAFVLKYERVVFALLSRMLGGGAHVEDLAQETFLRAFRAFPDFDPRGAAKPSTWLLTIATRLALDAKRRRGSYALSIGDGSEAAHTETPERHASRRELGAAIARAAAALPDDQRAAFVLAEFHGMSIAEIARALTVPENTAKTRLFRAREKLRKELGDTWRQGR